MVKITKGMRHTRKSAKAVMSSINAYHRLERRDRQVLGLADFIDADVTALESTRAPESSKAFDHELS